MLKDGSSCPACPLQPHCHLPPRDGQSGCALCLPDHKSSRRELSCACFCVSGVSSCALALQSAHSFSSSRCYESEARHVAGANLCGLLHLSSRPFMPGSLSHRSNKAALNVCARWPKTHRRPIIAHHACRQAKPLFSPPDCKAWCVASPRKLELNPLACSCLMWCFCMSRS